MDLDLKTVLRLLTPGDKILVFVLVVISGSSFALLKAVEQPGQIALVTVQGVQKFRKQLSEEERFVLHGPIGKTVIEIKTHSIQVINSDCPQKLCVRQGAIKNTGEIVVCVPNKTTIWIVGNRRNKFDAITG